jgi:aconitase A
MIPSQYDQSQHLGTLFFENFSMKIGEIEAIRDARALGVFGDAVTTDHISPAGGHHTDVAETGRLSDGSTLRMTQRFAGIT